MRPPMRPVPTGCRSVVAPLNCLNICRPGGRQVSTITFVSRHACLRSSRRFRLPGNPHPFRVPGGMSPPPKTAQPRSSSGSPSSLSRERTCEHRARHAHPQRTLSHSHTRRRSGSRKAGQESWPTGTLPYDYHVTTFPRNNRAGALPPSCSGHGAFCHTTAIYSLLNDCRFAS